MEAVWETETAGEGTGEDTHFIHPPRPAPLRMIGLPSFPTILSPSTLRMPVAMLACLAFNKMLVQRVSIGKGDGQKRRKRRKVRRLARL